MGGIDFSPMILVLLLYVINMVSQKYYRQPETCCCRGCGWRMSAVTVNDDGLVLRLYIQPKPAVILLSVYMATKLKSPLPAAG